MAREKWGKKTRVVARVNGRFAKLPSNYQERFSISPIQYRAQESQFVDGGRYIYIVKAGDESNNLYRGLTITSDKRLFMPAGSPTRKKLYQAIREKYNNYSFTAHSMRLVSSYDANTGKRFYCSR